MPDADRIKSLDVLRGVAVMGILAANIVAFGLPEPAYFSPAALGPPSRADLVAWALTFVLIEGKTRCLFSVLFGASMLLVIERAQAAGESPLQVHYSRLVWLFLIGMIHLYLFWWGDILTHYALVGAVAYAFWRLPTRVLLALAGLLILADLGIFATIAHELFDLATAAAKARASTGTIARWQDISAAFGRPANALLQREYAAAQGGFGSMLRWRLTTNVDPFSFAVIGGPQTLAYMLIGMAGLRSGFLTGEWSRRRYGWVAALSLGLALPGSAAIAWFDAGHGFDPRYVFVSSLLLSSPLRPVMATGYSAVVMLMMRGDGSLTARLAAAGRMAFSNYLGTTLVCTTIFYGWGFDLFGQLSRAALYGIVTALWIVMLAWSKPWLARFRYGPLEWLWRSAARLEWQPMRGAAR